MMICVQVEHVTRLVPPKFHFVMRAGYEKGAVVGITILKDAKNIAEPVCKDQHRFLRVFHTCSWPYISWSL